MEYKDIILMIVCLFIIYAGLSIKIPKIYTSVEEAKKDGVI